jgi:ribosomal protein S18 acetylase RimI-like enzyme
MASSNQAVVARATIEDAEEILALQKLAYRSEAEIIDDFAIPPLHQTLDETLSEFEQQVVLKVEHEGRVIASVRSYLEAGTCYIGKLIVHPDHQDRGLGTRLLRAAEDRFPAANRYELFTGQRSEKNLHIYRKAGYRVFKSRAVSEKLTLVFLEKPNRSE